MLRVQQRARERDLALDVARRLGLEQRDERGELRLEQRERARHTRGRVDAARAATVRRGLRGRVRGLELGLGLGLELGSGLGCGRGLRGRERAERRGQVVAERHEQLDEGRLGARRLQLAVRAVDPALHVRTPRPRR